MRFAALLLLGACGTVAPPLPSNVACATKSGIQILAPAPLGFCDEIQGVEDRTLEAFKKVVPFDGRFTQVAFPQWKIHVIDAETWVDEAGVSVVGQTYCERFTVCLNNNRPATGAFGHELAHVIQNCEPLQPWDLKDFYHSNWGPIFKALADASLTP